MSPRDGSYAPRPVPQPFIDLSSWDLPALADAWRAARPFPHVVIDGLVRDERRADLLDAFGEEPCSLLHDEIFELEASAIELDHPVLRGFRDELGGPAVREAVLAVTGKRLGRIEMRGYGYREGHYLLPHSDHQRGVDRALAYAYYLDTPFPVSGGELELFDCELEGGEVVAARSARVIPPLPNRIVLFDVGDVSLHQVREVLEGMRLSLAGWYYP